MKLPNRLYELYKAHLPDILLLIAIFFVIFFAQYIPYINLLIINIDPLLTSVVVVWIIFYLLKTPSAGKIVKLALVIFVFNYFLVLFHNQKIAELLSSLSFSMIFTAVLAEIVNFKKKFKKSLKP